MVWFLFYSPSSSIHHLLQLLQGPPQLPVPSRQSSVASGALDRKVLRARCGPVQPAARHGYCSRWSTQLYAVICDLSVPPTLPSTPYPAIPTLPCPLCSYTSPRLYPHLPGILHLSHTFYLSQTRPTSPRSLTPPKTVSTSPQHLPSDLTPLQDWIHTSLASSTSPLPLPDTFPASPQQHSHNIPRRLPVK